MAVPMPVDSLPKPRNKEVRRVVLSSFLGSTIEYYDFLLYATAAATVFAPVFFSDLPPLVGTIASMGTFAAGYLARPIGGIIFGHFGDRYGRKSMLMISMTIMGVASFLIGLVPAASSIGYWGAVILVLLRVCQGIAIGGEWGGAALMSLEHADSGRRGFAAAFTNAGAPTGSLLATIMLAIMALLPTDDFLAWGWRSPVPAIRCTVGCRTLRSSSCFREPSIPKGGRKQAEIESAAAKSAPPIMSVLRRPRNLILVAFGCTASVAIQIFFVTFALGYASQTGVPRSQALLGFAACQFLAIFAVLGFAKLSDRVGRRPVMLCGLAWLLQFSSFRSSP